MTRQEQFEYVKSHWYLRDGIVCSLKTGKPISFPCTNRNKYYFTNVRYKGTKNNNIRLHHAVYMLYHNRPIGERMEIHHIDRNPLNNLPSNLVELTPSQHRRIHYYQCDDPMRGIFLRYGAWVFQWFDADKRLHSKSFHGINEAMKFRAEVEEPYRAELRALGLDC